MSGKGLSKIAHFMSYLDEGMSKEDAAEKAGIKSATANAQHYKWRREKGISTPRKEKKVKAPKKVDSDGDVVID